MSATTVASVPLTAPGPFLVTITPTGGGLRMTYNGAARAEINRGRRLKT